MIYRVFDEDKSGELSFYEFLQVSWSLLFSVFTVRLVMSRRTL